MLKMFLKKLPPHACSWPQSRWVCIKPRVKIVLRPKLGPQNICVFAKHWSALTCWISMALSWQHLHWLDFKTLKLQHQENEISQPTYIWWFTICTSSIYRVKTLIFYTLPCPERGVDFFNGLLHDIHTHVYRSDKCCDCASLMCDDAKLQRKSLSGLINFNMYCQTLRCQKHSITNRIYFGARAHKLESIFLQ